MWCGRYAWRGDIIKSCTCKQYCERYRVGTLVGTSRVGSLVSLFGDDFSDSLLCYADRTRNIYYWYHSRQQPSGLPRPLLN